MCVKNHLTTLPPLPQTLHYLDCSKNDIQFLPPLPHDLIVLDCQENPLETLPEFPLSLTSITCEMPFDKSRLEIKHMFSETVQRINEEVRYGMKVLSEESKERSLRRCKTYKEEIMMKVWHPSRVAMMYAMGYDVEDM
jgi:hypothetical protein